MRFVFNPYKIRYTDIVCYDWTFEIWIREWKELWGFRELYLLLKNIGVKLVLLFKFVNYKTEEPFVSTAKLRTAV